MYTIKNTSSKIIHIGKTVLMPDQTMEASDNTANLPSIQAFANRKMLEVTAVSKALVADEKDAKDDGKQEGTGESSGEESGEDKAPEAPKGARRTTRKAADSKE